MLKIIKYILEQSNNNIEPIIDDLITCSQYDMDSLLLLDEHTSSLKDNIYSYVISHNWININKIKHFVDKYKKQHLQKFICNGFGIKQNMNVFEYLLTDPNINENEIISTIQNNDFIEQRISRYQSPLNAQLEKIIIKNCEMDRLNIIKCVIKTKYHSVKPPTQAMVYCSENNVPHILKYLLENGGDPKAYNDSLLLLATKNNLLENIKLLLQYGASIKHVMQEAAIHGFIDILKYLLDNGVDTHKHAINVLMWSAANKSNYMEVIKILLDAGADINTFSDDTKITWSDNGAKQDLIKFVEEQKILANKNKSKSVDELVEENNRLQKEKEAIMKEYELMCKIVNDVRSKFV